MDVADFRILYDYNFWANRRVLEACAPLSAEEFTRQNGSSFPSVRETLAHICGAEWIWLERWNGRVPTGGIPAATDYPDFETLKQRWTEIESDLLDYVGSLTPEDVNRVVEFKTLGWCAASRSSWDNVCSTSPITALIIAGRSPPCCASWAQNLPRPT